MAMYGHGAKGSLEKCVNRIMNKWVEWMMQQPVVDRIVVDRAYECFQKDVRELKISAGTIARHVVALTFEEVEMTIPVKGLEAEYNLMQSRLLKEQGHHCGLPRLAAVKAIAGPRHVALGLQIAPDVLANLKDVVEDINRFIDELPPHVQGEDIVPHLNEQMVYWESKDGCPGFKNNNVDHIQFTV